MLSQSTVDEREPGGRVAAIGSFISGAVTKKQGPSVGHRANLWMEKSVGVQLKGTPKFLDRLLVYQQGNCFPGLGLSSVGWALLHQSLIKKVLDRFKKDRF